MFLWVRWEKPSMITATISQERSDRLIDFQYKMIKVDPE